MYSFKLLDAVLQGVTFVSGLLLLMIYDAYGYFFWINLGLVIWILISMVLNLIFAKPLTILRKVFSILLLVLIVLFGVAYVNDTTIPRLNFYYRPLSIILIIYYLFMSLLELTKMKGDDEIDLDF